MSNDAGGENWSDDEEEKEVFLFFLIKNDKKNAT